MRVLKGRFSVFYICIFDITMLFPSQMVTLEVLGFVVYLTMLNIISIAIVASIQGMVIK